MTRNNQKNRANLGLITEADVVAANQRLKDARIKVRIRLNGKVLGVRATLPLKTGTGRKQQDIRMGISANGEGLQLVETLARDLHRQLENGLFQWSEWQHYGRSQEEDDRTIAGLVERFKVDYMRANKIKASTWRETWERTFDRLPQSEELTESLVLAVVLSTEEHSRLREQTCQRMQKLASYAGIDIDLASYRGDYEPEPRDIPTDELIVQWRDQIPNEQWQWVYGMIAAFGIRPSEYFHFEFIDPLAVRILDAKSQKWKTTRSIPPGWAEKWNLIDAKCPEVTGGTFRDYGQRCSKQFGRYDLPFVPYDLRHAFAVRASVVSRLPVSTAAAFMGHSVATHTRVYHRWLSDATNQEVYDRLILGNRSRSPEMLL